jgi:shikimate kinase
MSEQLPKLIFLIGFMGSGKSHEGELLASHLGLPFIDLDQKI